MTATLPYRGRRRLPPVVLGGLLLFAGCAPFHPTPLPRIALNERAAFQTSGDLTVTVAVLGAKETQQVFGANLYRQGIQPVWIEVTNRSTQTLWFVPVATDPDYFPPLEVAYRNHVWAASTINQRMDDYFQARTLPSKLPPDSTNAGFVFTQLSVCAKAVNVELVGDRHVQRFLFIVPVPGFEADWQLVNFDRLHAQSEHRAVDDAALGRELATMPPWTTDSTGRQHGDPLNVIVVGSFETLLSSFIRSGWHLTQPLTAGSSWTTFEDFLLDRPYVTAPVSPLYVFGRRQDLAFQKARASLSYRNHVRLWLTSLVLDGKPVWLGQISRDVGVKLTTRTWNLTTHVIAPDVDETRDYLAAMLAQAQSVAKVGWVAGVGAVPASAPRRTLTGDPYYTDGRRVVVVLADEPTPENEVERLNWDISG